MREGGTNRWERRSRPTEREEQRKMRNIMGGDSGRESE